MDDKIITSLIALMGVFISIMASFIANKRLLRAEVHKIKTAVEQDYALKIVEKRLEFYPVIYELISDMSKKVKRILNELTDEKITINDLLIFSNKYNKLNSKYSVVFSTSSGSCSYQLRTNIEKIIKSYSTNNLADIVSLKNLNLLSEKVGELEFSLKNDLGVFIVEFQDAKRELSIRNYGELKKVRALKKKNKI